MGLFDFIKDAGEKLLDGVKGHDLKADKLISHIKNLGIDGIKNSDIKVDGDVVKVFGDVVSQEVKEKVLLALGNVAGVAKVESALKVLADGGENAQLYTVKSGDTLSSIAKRLYGNANAYMAIFEANKPMLKDPSKIYPGQTLRIPPKK